VGAAVSLSFVRAPAHLGYPGLNGCKIVVVGGAGSSSSVHVLSRISPFNDPV